MTNETRDYGDLQVTMTSDYDWRWDDTSTGCKRAIKFWHPKSQGSLRPLGTVGIDNYTAINNQRATILVGPTSNGNQAAVASPVDYSSVWTDKGTGGKFDCNIWRPIPPNGYVSMGDVVTDNYSKPSVDAVWCVRADLTRNATYEASSFWDDTNGGGKYDCSCWHIKPNSMGENGAEKIPILADTFRAHQSYSRPDIGMAVSPVLVLKKEFQQFNTPLPKITPTTIPATGDTLHSMEQCGVTLPFIAFFPPTDRESLDSIRTPFCSLRRSIAWHVEGVWSNGAGGVFHREKTIKTGVSAEQSSEMTHSAGVQISASAGIFGVSTSVSLNYQFTSTTSTSYAEYSESTVTEKFDVPAHHATVLFSKHVRLTYTRGNQSSGHIEIVANDDIHFVGCNLP